MKVPIVECGGTQAGFDIFGASRMFDTDELRVDAVPEFERKFEEGTISWRDGGHDGRGA